MIAIITKIAIALQISSNLLLSICWVESHYRNVINQDDGGSPSYGICQVKLDTANWMKQYYKLPGDKLTDKDLMTPEINAFYAGLYVKYQIKRYKGDIDCVISAYNAGTCTKRNSNYVKKVKDKWKLLGGSDQ